MEVVRRPVVVVGNSIGGYISASLAAENPNLVKGALHSNMPARMLSLLCHPQLASLCQGHQQAAQAMLHCSCPGAFSAAYCLTIWHAMPVMAGSRAAAAIHQVEGYQDSAPDTIRIKSVTACPCGGVGSGTSCSRELSACCYHRPCYVLGPEGMICRSFDIWMPLENGLCCAPAASVYPCQGFHSSVK